MAASRFQFGVMAATIFGAVFTLFGTIMYCMWPSIFNNILTSKMVLSPDSASFELWEVTPIPMYIEFYLFNWTNPEDFEDPDRNISKPRLEQHGPYVFKEHRVKVVQEWCDENNTITYLQNRTWFFQPELSNGALDDLITTINVPAVTATYAMRHHSIFNKLLLAAAMSTLHTKIHTTKTAREFLFDGYSDPLINLASLLPPGMAPVTIPFDKFGWFYARNGSATYDGVYNMYTGVGDISKFGEISAWNYSNRTKFYEAHCGVVNGSAGEFFPPYQNKEKISLFSSDVCRTITLEYKEPTTFEGVAGYRYQAEETMFDNTSLKPDNWCFCEEEECPPSGSYEVSACKWGAPAFVSFPHFYLADPIYRQGVDGMEPNASIHQVYLDIEPRSGIPIQVSAALQINILVQPMETYGFLKHVPEVYFPCLWFRQRAHIEGEVGKTARMVSILPSIGSIVFLVMLSTGISIIAVLAICLVTRMCKKEEDTVVLNTSPTPIPNSAASNASSVKAANIKSMKALLHAYFWRQKVIPSHSVITQVGQGKGVQCINIATGKINVIIPHEEGASPADFSYPFENNNEIRGTLQTPDSNGQMTPLSIDQELQAMADRM